MRAALLLLIAEIRQLRKEVAELKSSTPTTWEQWATGSEARRAHFYPSEE